MITSNENEREIILKHIQDAEENACVDFKREFYTSLKKSDIVKDIAAFANLANGEDKYIIFGVDDETREIVGVNPETIVKQDDIDSYLENKIEPFPEVYCRLIKINDGKNIGYIKVSSKNSNPPYIIKETCGKDNRIEKGDIFIRKGTCNKKASRADIDEMYMKNGELMIRIHDEVTVVEPIHIDGDKFEPLIFGHIDIEIFNDTTRPLLLTGGNIEIKKSKCEIVRSVWSTKSMKNMQDYPLEIPANTRKIYKMLYDFSSQDCVDMGFDVEGFLDDFVDVRVGLKDTDGYIYECNRSKMLMRAKGDVLHKVRRNASYKKRKPLLLRNRISWWFK